MNKQTTPSKKITVGLILSWFFGCLLSLAGIPIVFSVPRQGLVMLIMAAVLLPPINKIVEEKFNFRLFGGVKVVVIIIGFIILGSIVVPSETIRHQEQYKGILSTTKDNSVTARKNHIPANKRSALNKATMYANTMHMSKCGVYDQLVSEYGEKFTTDAAQYAIENVEANWNANALIKAKTYQNTMNMSPAAIHDQLTSEHGEKFTKSEADYASRHLNR